MDEESRPGQRQYHDTKAAYALPNDNTEHDRLEIQSKALEALMSNEIFHAPCSNPKRILDVGCGTGRTTVQLAEKYPDAQVIGIDLSPVPAIRPKPKNVVYIQGDVREMIKAGKEPFVPGAFDYVFGRLLVAGMTDWKGYFEQIRTILAPGGWFEVQEPELGFRDAHGISFENEIPVWTVLLDLFRRKGMEPSIAKEARDLMQECGLVNVNVKAYKEPHVEAPDNPRTAMISKVCSRIAIVLQPVWYRLGEGVYSREELDRMSQELIDIYANFPSGTHNLLNVITGCKKVE